MDPADTYRNIEELLIRFFDGEVSKDEMFIIEKWKNESQENLKIYNDYLKIWEASAKARNVPNVDVGRAWKKFEFEVRNSKTKNQGKLIHLFTGSFARIAAAALILIGLASVIYFFVLSDGINHVYTEIGKSQTIKLEDGSIVTLNASTQFTYPDQFKGAFRQVELSGEAYFEIARNENQPFIIKVNGTLIKVLGTSFNVKSIENNMRIEVNVNSGKVAFGEDGKDNQIVLKAGEKGVFSKADQVLTKSVTDDPNLFAWRTKKLDFDNAKLDYVIKVLNAAYYSNIKLTNPQLSNCTLTAGFDQQDLNAILEVIGLALDLKITKNKNEILLTGQACED